MLRLAGGQVESLLDELLPVEVHEPAQGPNGAGPAAGRPVAAGAITQVWAQAARPWPADHPDGSFVRLMVIKQRPGWGTRRWSGRCRTRCTCAGSACR
jgi:hypothetical protein